MPRRLVFVCLIRGDELRGEPHIRNLSLFTDKINRRGCTNAVVSKKKEKKRKEDKEAAYSVVHVAED